MKIKRRKLEVTPPYVSMADIAFNLVLFFLILAKTQEDAKFQWVPAKSAEVKEVAKTRLVVMVDNTNKVYLNAQEVSVRELAERLAAELGNDPAEPRVVLLKIHKDTLAATFEPIMEAVSQTGCEVYHVLEEEVP